MKPWRTLISVIALSSLASHIFSPFSRCPCLSETVGAKKPVCPHRCQARPHSWCLLVRMACNRHKCHIIEVMMLSPKKVELGKKWRELTNHGQHTHIETGVSKRHKKLQSFNLYVLLSLRMSFKPKKLTAHNPHLFSFFRDMLRRQQTSLKFKSSFCLSQAAAGWSILSAQFPGTLKLQISDNMKNNMLEPSFRDS